MPTFKVTWETELYNSKTPLEAVQNAFNDIKNGESLCFTVENLKTGEEYSVDLNEEGGKQVSETTMLK